MAVTLQERTEGEILRMGYEQVLRLLENRRTSDIGVLLALIRKETGKAVTLVARCVFMKESGANRPCHSNAFSEYAGRFESVLFRYNGTPEYSNWFTRYADFKINRPDFEAFAVMIEYEPIASPASPSRQKRVYEITANDRRFLRRLRIAPYVADEPS